MEIKIYHTNDVHSHFHNYLKIKSYLTDIRSAEKDKYLYVDVGDHVDRSHPLTEATLGKANVDLLNDANCSVATIGNNEGITLNQNDLRKLYQDATFDVICANLRLRNNDEPFFPPFVIKEVQGIKIGFIGATVEFTPFYEALDWEVSGAFHWIKEAVEALKGNVDCIIMMSHLGVYDDESLAQQFPEIDVILGGHTHHHFVEGKVVNQTLMAAAGRFGEYIGEVTITFNDAHEVIEKSARLIDVELLSTKHNKTYDKGKQLLQTPIKDDCLPIERRIFSASRFMNILSEMIMKFTNTDATIINTGLVVKPFDGGLLTEYDLHKVLPHAINAVKIEVTGRELKEIIDQSKDHQFENDVVKGMGFRGDLFGRFVTYNVGYIESKREYFVGGELIDDHAIYKLGTLDMYTFGRFFPQFKSARKQYYMPEFLRDIVKHYQELL